MIHNQWIDRHPVAVSIPHFPQFVTQIFNFRIFSSNIPENENFEKPCPATTREGGFPARSGHDLLYRGGMTSRSAVDAGDESAVRTGVHIPQ